MNNTTLNQDHVAAVVESTEQQIELTLTELDAIGGGQASVFY